MNEFIEKRKMENNLSKGELKPLGLLLCTYAWL